MEGLAEHDFVSVNEAARRAKIAPKTIYRWISDSKVPAFGRGNAIRVRMSDVLAPFVSKRDYRKYDYRRKKRPEVGAENMGPGGENTTPPPCTTEPSSE